MRRSYVLYFKNSSAVRTIITNRLLILFFALFVSGIVMGSVCFFNSETARLLAENSFTHITSVREQASFMRTFSSSILCSLAFLLLLFILGTSIFGTVTAPILLVVRGFLYGNTAALLYSQHGIKGIAFHALIIIPPAVITMLSLFSAADCAVDFSLKIAKLTLPRSVPFNLYDLFKKYCIRFLCIFFALIFASVCDAMLSYFLFDKLI